MAKEQSAGPVGMPFSGEAPGPRHKAVVWDFDGVLGDSRRLSWRAAKEILALIGQQVEIETQETFRDYMVHGVDVSREEAEILRSMHRLVMRSRADQIPLFDCVALAAHLAVPSEIVTSGLADVARIALGETAASFVRIRGRESGDKQSLLDTLPANALFVTDTTVDVARAKERSIPTIAVTWGYDPEEELVKEEPDFLVRTSVELGHVFRELELVKA